MFEKCVVHVSYSGEVVRSMRTASHLRIDPSGVIDTRFQPFADNNEERAKLPPKQIDIGEWIITEKFMNAVHTKDLGFNSELDVNTYLTLLSHFGFDAPYTSTFVRKLEPMIAEAMLQSFLVKPVKPISDRLFNGVVYSRATFFDKFDNFLIKYGL